jgi:hypothetical protein
LKVALSATHNNPEGELQNIRPMIERCIAILEGREYDMPFMSKEEEEDFNHFMKSTADDIAFMSKDEEEDFSNFTKDTWYADGAASTHMGNMDVGMFNYEDINERVTVGNGKTV